MDDWDWEVLHDSQETVPVVEVQGVEVEETLNSASSSPISPGDGGVIRADYFSLDSHHNYVEDEVEEGESSDNPSWIDPSGSSLVGRGERKTSSCNSDASDASDNILLIEPHTDCSAGNGNGVDIGESNMEDIHEGGEEKTEVGDGGLVREKEEEEEERGLNLESDENKKVVWWRVPIEMLRYCVMRVNPVWSLSMAAAAVMGFVLLRRQYLNKVKRKTMGLQLKVTVDDKKVSQFMTRVARLNEAFSVVKRVPIIRPSLPAPGLAPWPVVSMR